MSPEAGPRDAVASGSRPLAGRRALVTGAASGIGLAIAERLASAGAAVVMTDLPGERLDEAAAGVEGATAVGADLSDRASLQALVADAGDVHVLVNNAGFQHVSRLEELDPDIWERLLAVMLTAPFLLTSSVLPDMYAAGWGRVINIASVHGLVASPFKAAYVSAKHGLLGLTKTTALEMAQQEGDVTAHAICPSYVRTPLVEAQVEAQAELRGIAPAAVISDVLLEANAVKRLIEPRDVAEVVGFLCGPAAWTMTGAVISMDAGWLAH
jgi:3-hydroxybutyrate dehydrogenase